MGGGKAPVSETQAVSWVGEDMIFEQMDCATPIDAVKMEMNTEPVDGELTSLRVDMLESE